MMYDNDDDEEESPVIVTAQVHIPPRPVPMDRALLVRFIMARLGLILLMLFIAGCSYHAYAEAAHPAWWCFSLFAFLIGMRVQTVIFQILGFKRAYSRSESMVAEYADFIEHVRADMRERGFDLPADFDYDKGGIYTAAIGPDGMPIPHEPSSVEAEPSGQEGLSLKTLHDYMETHNEKPI